MFFAKAPLNGAIPEKGLEFDQGIEPTQSGSSRLGNRTRWSLFTWASTTGIPLGIWVAQRRAATALSGSFDLSVGGDDTQGSLVIRD